MSNGQDMEQNGQGDSHEIERLRLTRNSRSFATIMPNTSSTLLEQSITEKLPYGTLSEKDRNSSSGALSDITEELVRSSQSDESLSEGDTGRPKLTEPLESAQPKESSFQTENGRPPLAPPPETLATDSLPLSTRRNHLFMSAEELPESAPVPNLQQPLARSDHQRLRSAGESSFMSSITEISADGNTKVRQSPKRTSRHRKVSWDQNFFDSAGVPCELPPAFLPPALQQELSPAPFFPKRDDSPQSTNGKKAQHRRLGSTLTLADLKMGSPMETEAETAIIAALEEEIRIEEKRSRSDSASILMPHVPDEGLDMFESKSRKSIPDLKMAASPDSAKSVDRSSAKSLGSLKAMGSNPKGKSHLRKKSTMPPEGLALDQSKTLESTLTGLADAMRMIHIESTENADRKEIKRGQGHQRLPSRDIGHPAAVMETIPVNNADVLVHNANLLLRRNLPRDDSSQIGLSPEAETSSLRAPKPNTVWNLFETKPDPKKTDGDHLDDDQEHSSESQVEVEAVDYELISSESMRSNPDETDSVSVIEIEEGRREGTEGCPSRPITLKKEEKNTERIFDRTKRNVMKGWDLFVDFLRPERASIAMYCRVVFLFLLPCIAGVAAILFYAAGNPIMTAKGASISWLLLFTARQVVTLTFSKATSLLVIDFWSLRTRWTVRLFGPTIALFIVQSKGFPFLLAVWSIYDFVLLSGGHSLANHWLFWQDLIAMCNENNPSGGITSSSMNFRVLGTALAVGIAVSIKRVWVGLYLGRRTFGHYGDQLAKVIQNMILISEVASLGRDFERMGQSGYNRDNVKESFQKWDYDAGKSDEDTSVGSHQVRDHSFTLSQEKVIDEGRRDKLTGSLSPSQRIKMMQLLDFWDEPETVRTRHNVASINAILQFRQALAFMDNSYPFSLAFGPSENRESCIESAQKVYERLMLHTPDLDWLPFETIALLATKHGRLDQKKMKELIRIFRPRREGHLSMIDFVRSCDTVYKSLRLLRASIANAGQIDHALEVLINWGFYVVLVCLILAANGLDPLAMFLSFSSILLAFAFMIGSASSKYFEGILFILVRRPYDIGDRIAIANVENEANLDGAVTWFVQNVDLFTTTVRFAGTNEVATLANGSLAASRIINGARSPKGVVHVLLKFGVDVPYSKVQVFKKTVEAFVKARPREWVSLLMFRSTRVEADLGFIEYALDLQHRDSWQNMPSIVMSKADLASFCLEVQKQLDMRYIPPSLPVDLNLKDTVGLHHPKDNTLQAESQLDDKDSPRKTKS